MARTIQHKRGLEKNLPTLKPGELAFTTDTKKVFVGSDTGNVDITSNVDTSNLATKSELSSVTETLAIMPTKEYVNTQVMTIPKGEKGEKGDPGTASVAIDDSVINSSQTWSAQKINERLTNIKVKPTNATFIKVGKNLVNNSKNIVGERASHTSGVITSDTTRSRTGDYIEVEEGVNYTFTVFRDTDLVRVNNEFDAVYYDKDYKYISGIRAFSETGYALVPPAGAKFAIFNIKSLTRFMQLEKSTTSTSYENYSIEIENQKKETIYINSDKRSILGEMAKGYGSSPVLISKANRTVTITGQLVLYYRNVRKVVKPSADPDLVLQLPTASPSAMSDFVYYDIKNSKFILTSGGELQTKVNEDCVMVMNVIIDTNGEMTVNADLNYIVEGTKAPANIYFAPVDLPNHYECMQDCSDFSVNPNVTSIAQFQTAWNNLVSSYNGYITNEIVGKDATGAYDIYRQKYKPERPYLYSANKQLPTLTINVGIHGEEKGAIFSAYYFFKDMLENWKENSFLEYLRFNMNIDLIPVANPYGFQHSQRSNGNSVDLNRNWPYNHDPAQAGGTAPFSEVETQYVKKMIDDNPNAIYYLDYHDTMTSSGEDYPDAIVHVISNKAVSQDIAMGAYHHISKMTRIFHDKYDSGNGNEFYGRSGSNAYAISPSYPLSKGISASLLEGFSKFPNETEYYSPTTIKANAESFGNWLLTIVNMHKNKA